MVMPKESTQAGLMSKAGRIPLQGVKVEAEIKDFAIRQVVSQRYVNHEANPIEAVYVFPLDEAAAVCGFEAVIGGTVIKGEVKEREEAFKTYDDAISAGHGAFLLDQEKADVFTMSVGNVAPGQEVLIRITTVAELGLEGEEIRYVLPSTVSPRYAPEEDRKGVGRTPAEAVNPPVAWSVPYGLEFEIGLEMASDIKRLESPTHPISVEVEGKKGKVRLGERETALDRDFVLKVALASPPQARAWAETSVDGKPAALLAFQPKFSADDSEKAPAELIFLIDRSGSMDGTSIAEARNALQLCLRSLREGVAFNIVGFGSTHAFLFPKSVSYGDDSLKKASDHVRSIGADMGGTEILPALEAILQTEPESGRPRQLFVLTDGEVSNTEAVIALVRKHSASTRVFTFGIGAGASHHLVKGMARAGEGTAEFIAPGERMEGKVLRQLSKALSPAYSDVEIDWGGLKPRQAPHRIPPAFDGHRILVYGLFEAAGQATVTLKAMGPSGAVTFSLPLDLSGASEGTLISTLAARTLIRDLEEGSSPLHTRRGSLQGRARPEASVTPEKQLKAELVALGTKYGLVSKETSYVAVEERKDPVTGQMQLRKIPVALTRGWGGSDAKGASMAALGAGLPPTATFSMHMPGAPPPPPAPAPAASAPGGFIARAMKPLLKKSARPPVSADMDAMMAAPAQEMEEARTQSESTLRPLDRLVALQKADGSWELSEGLASILGKKLPELQKAIPGPVNEAVQKAFATALALAWLEKHAARERDEWMLLARKAESWLKKQAAPASGAWTDLAAKFLA